MESIVLGNKQCNNSEEGSTSSGFEEEGESERYIASGTFDQGLHSKSSGFAFAGESPPKKNGSPQGRKFSKLNYNSSVSQQKRREYALDYQKKRRDDILEKIRQLDGDACSESEAEDEEYFGKLAKKSCGSNEDMLEEEVGPGAEVMEVGQDVKKQNKSKTKNRFRNRRNRPAPCLVMLSEWLTEKPVDFEEEWIGLFCPVGKRCLVVASRGKTRVYSRVNEYMGVYQSLLPGGRNVNYSDSTHNRSRGVTLLDCVWSEQSQVFYVLDIVCWNSHSCNNCETDYRQFFLRSKFMESPELAEKTPLNPFPFIVLPTFSCDQLSEILMTGRPSFVEQVDGVLFYHKKSFYYPGTNPLTLWAYLTDIEGLLGSAVSPDLLACQKKHKKKINEVMEVVE